MTTLVVSDLHLGADGSLLTSGEVRSSLVAEVERADRLILLGDVVDLRHAPVRAVLEGARPILEELGEAASEVVLVPGNHDHRLAAPILDRRRLQGAPLALDETAAPGLAGVAGEVTRWLGGATLAYPGIWLRPDVYATHGHYLDCHATVPRPEVVLASMSQRVTGRIPPSATPSDYETALGPIYAAAFELAQAALPATAADNRPARAWRALKGSGWRVFDTRTSGASRRANALVIGGAVALLNRAGLGPFRSDLSSDEIGRAATAAMREVVARLGIDADYVVYGHTHRAGGSDLINAGSWSASPNWPPVVAGDDPYRAGTCVVVEETGPPRLVKVLERVPETDFKVAGAR